MAVYTCPQCLKEVSNEMSKCSNCGYEIGTIPITTKCFKCDTVNDYKSKRCSKCGEKLLKYNRVPFPDESRYQDNKFNSFASVVCVVFIIIFAFLMFF